MQAINIVSIALNRCRIAAFGLAVFFAALLGTGSAQEKLAKFTDKSPAETLRSKKTEIETTTNSLGMKLVLIPAGDFMLGAEEDLVETLGAFPYCDAKWLADESPRHAVRITKSFYMGQHEVTLGQFLAFYHASGYKPEVERDGKPSWGYEKAKLVESNKFRPWAPGWEIAHDHPAVFISWNDAIAFCEWLSKTEGRSYRLPTEAEWEYACRAGSDTRYSFGDDHEELTRFGNGPDQDRKVVSPKAVIASSADKEKKSPGIPFPYLITRDGFAWTAPVGKFRPNAFGLHDMHGNVWEWCSDWYHERYYEVSPSHDPQGPEAGKRRVIRGGAFNFIPFTMRSADRNHDHPSSRSCSYGFRVVCEQESTR